MATRSAYATRNAIEIVNQEASYAPIDTLAEKVINAEFRDDFEVLAQALTTQVNRKVLVPVNLIVCMETSRVRDFIKMNSPELLWF